MALVTDSLSPLLTTVAIDMISTTQFPFVTFQLASRQSPLRGIALCFSGVCRALCGVVAGGSKAALTLHFAQPDNGAATGDVGDMSAKDGSKETVLALFGMLVSCNIHTRAFGRLTMRETIYCSAGQP